MAATGVAHARSYFNRPVSAEASAVRDRAAIAAAVPPPLASDLATQMRIDRYLRQQVELKPKVLASAATVDPDAAAQALPALPPSPPSPPLPPSLANGSTGRGDDRARRRPATAAASSAAAHTRERVVTFAFTKRRTPVVARALKSLGARETHKADATACVIWMDSPLSLASLRLLAAHQRVNRFPGLHTAISKRALARTFGRLAIVEPDEYGFAPRSWELPAEAPGCVRFMQSRPGAMLICKPQGGSCGRGIFLCDSAAVLGKLTDHVAQEYIARPLLIGGLKWDLRVYVAVTGVDPLSVHVYREGLARFATQEYADPTAANVDNVFMHLTNYSLNKHSDDFIASDEAEDADGWSHATKRLMTTLFDQLEALGHNVDELWWQIKNLIAKAMHAIHPALARLYRTAVPRSSDSLSCFQLLGFDILVDEALTPWLLEINNAPSLACDQTIDWDVKEPMLASLLRMMHVQPPPPTSISRSASRLGHGDGAAPPDVLASSGFERRVRARRAHEDSHADLFERVCPPNSIELREYSHRAPFDSEAVWLAYNACCWRKHADDEHALAGQNFKKLLRTCELVQVRGFTSMEADLLFRQYAKHDDIVGPPRLSFALFCDALLELADRLHPHAPMRDAVAAVCGMIESAFAPDGPRHPSLCCGAEAGPS